MSLESTPFYWIVCDGCGTRAEYYGGEYAAWAEPDQAIDLAIEDGWHVGHYDGDDWALSQRHHCPDCEWFCERCLRPAGPLAGERDYLCATCYYDTVRPTT